MKNSSFLKKVTISENSSIKDAYEKITSTGINCLCVTNKKNLLGTISDGDLRKALLGGMTLRSKIQSIYTKSPIFIYKDEIELEKKKKLFLKHKLTVLPVVDKKMALLDVYEWNEVFKRKSKQRKIYPPVIIMAGGLGTRMAPFTQILPKPLIPIGDRTIIEMIIAQFNEIGLREVYLSINYKAEILKAFFKELSFKYKLSFLEEKKPLGTVGILSKLKAKLDAPFFVTNCDILINANYHEIYSYHKKNNNHVTIVASAKEFVIPYGICKVKDKGVLDRIEEKPRLDFLVNCGMYVISPEILNLIPSNKKYDMPDLINKAMQKDFKIGVFPVRDKDWIDIGQWDEYRKAVDLFK